MVWATIYLTGQDWMIPAAGVVLISLLISYLSYRNVGASRGLRNACQLLRFLGILALAACLLEPFWSGQRSKKGANLFLVLADNSEGMTIKDKGQTRSRGDFLTDLVMGDSSGWQDPLEEHFQVRRYFFDSRLQSTRDFGELNFQGRYSALGGSLQNLARRFENRPVAGILLLTDGNATDWKDGTLDTDGLPPIYPVVLGDGDVSRDIAIGKVGVSQTSFEDAPITIQADVQVTGYAGKPITLQVHGLKAPRPNRASAAASATTNGPPASSPPPAGTPLASDTQTPSRNTETLAYRFQLKPEQTGVVFYQLSVAAQDEWDQLDQPERSREATLANNHRTVVVNRGRGPYRILYVGGRPNWEYKFLTRALAEDTQVNLVGLLRIARREPKFVFKGRQGESSNPLFRGFDRKNEETEQYDQPVLIRLNTRDELELKGGFPKAEEDLFAYHALIVDDLDAAFFTRDQMSLVSRFVSHRGGGFLMLGGPDSFRDGEYQRTPIGSMLPIYLDQAERESPPQSLRLSLTREGWLQPWARLRSNESSEKQRLEEMPGFIALNRADSIKPGATILGMVQDKSGIRQPGLVVQRFGHGRTGALLIGDYWRWGMKDESMQEDLGKAWRQMVRWLVADVPERTSLLLEPDPEDPNRGMRIDVTVNDESFLPQDNAEVSVTVGWLDPADTPGRSSPSPDPGDMATNAPTTLELTAEPALDRSGQYTTTYVPRRSGGYFVSATARNAKGRVIGQSEAGWTTDTAADEFQSLKPNRAQMETLAARTGGRVVEAADLAKFVGDLPREEAPIQETWSRPIWHHTGVLLFTIACFAAEWGLRRRNGLA